MSQTHVLSDGVSNLALCFKFSKSPYYPLTYIYTIYTHSVCENHSIHCIVFT